LVGEALDRRHARHHVLPEVTMECLPGPLLPDELKGRGSGITAIGQGERIPPSAIVQRVIRNAAGDFEPMAASSTLPVALPYRAAGISKIERYGFDFTLLA